MYYPLSIHYQLLVYNYIYTHVYVLEYFCMITFNCIQLIILKHLVYVPQATAHQNFLEQLKMECIALSYSRGS